MTVVDFEFGNFKVDGESTTILVSAAVGDIATRQINKLVGPPLLIKNNTHTNTHAPQLSTYQIQNFLKVQHNIFVKKINKPECYQNLVTEINEGMKQHTPTLTHANLHHKLQNKILITFAGNTDFQILKNLGITSNVYSLECDDLESPTQFSLYLRQLPHKTRLASLDVGHQNKNGRMLSLSETHNILCKKIHEGFTNDPSADVIMTGCLLIKLRFKTKITLQ